MDRPGRYAPDLTEGITNVNDLPTPQRVGYHRDQKQASCPRCGRLASRHKSGQRTLHDLGDLYTGHPVDLLVAYSSHYQGHLVFGYEIAQRGKTR